MLSYWQKCLTLDFNNEQAFNDIALEAMHFQYEQVSIYSAFIDALGRNISDIDHYTQIPYLPIQFFKSHRVQAGELTTSPLIFESSGTTGMDTSKHYVAQPEIYESSFLNTFNKFYGAPSSYIFLCLLPSYLERSNSSLVYMCHHLVQQSGQEVKGFYLNEYEKLNDFIVNYSGEKKLFIIGVTFALLDWAEQSPIDLSKCILMETGGMKGRREEWTRAQVHDYLQTAFNLKAIHSEYGMTELLSQAYSKGYGIFEAPSYMKILVRDEHDPFSISASGTGLINVIDLANINACSFIATDDIGKIHNDGTFEVLGRRDNSLLRGCSMLAL